MKVKFLPSNEEHEIKPSQTLLELAQERGIFIKSVCNGVPNCAECRIQIVEGDHNIFPPSKKELALIGTAHFIDNRRLACQVRCFGDVTISLQEQVEKQKSEGQKKRMKAGVREDETHSHALSGDLLEQDTDIVESIGQVSDKEILEAETEERGLEKKNFESDSRGSDDSRGGPKDQRQRNDRSSRNRKSQRDSQRNKPRNSEKDSQKNQSRKRGDRRNTPKAQYSQLRDKATTTDTDTENSDSSSRSPSNKENKFDQKNNQNKKRNRKNFKNKNSKNFNNSNKSQNKHQDKKSNFKNSGASNNASNDKNQGASKK